MNNECENYYEFGIRIKNYKKDRLLKVDCNKNIYSTCNNKECECGRYRYIYVRCRSKVGRHKGQVRR